MLIYHAIFNNKTEKSFNLKDCAMNDNFCNMMNQIFFQFMANILITEVKNHSKLGELSVKFQGILSTWYVPQWAFNPHKMSL